MAKYSFITFTEYSLAVAKISLVLIILWNDVFLFIQTELAWKLSISSHENISWIFIFQLSVILNCLFGLKNGISHNIVLAPEFQNIWIQPASISTHENDLSVVQLYDHQNVKSP